MKAAEVKFLHSAAGRKGGKPKGIKAGICLLGLLFASKGDSEGAEPPVVPPQSCKGDAPPSLLLVPCPLGWWLRCRWWHWGVLHLSESLVPPQICPSCFAGRCTRFRCDPGLQPSCHRAVPIPRGLDLSWRTDGSLKTLPQWSKTPRSTCLSPSRHMGWGTVGLLPPRWVAWHVAGWLQTATGLLPHTGSHCWLSTPTCCPHISHICCPSTPPASPPRTQEPPSLTMSPAAQHRGRQKQPAEAKREKTEALFQNMKAPTRASASPAWEDPTTSCWLSTGAAAVPQPPSCSCTTQQRHVTSQPPRTPQGSGLPPSVCPSVLPSPVTQIWAWQGLRSRGC